ncbi:hypothetical protein PHAVU_005G127900 [Phaseolus vulgaris]|uniref:AT-hook motif nuclear-localized protein n=1 Tax=Phaseolus vulgaris TaxID=3885 RepID=V7BYG0_PHAVU|nr:hypothetical protein PHAVU_005G127900g [Phaseolus vulgaris]ESW22108.1 hypothetical protein PHAVU_005G127900g [Phaseolus vulgaris]
MAERDHSKNKNPVLGPDEREKKRETGTSFVPHQIRVNVGEDVVEKVTKLAKTCSQTVCVLSAVGSISSAVFSKPGLPSTDTVKWEGRFEIMSLSGKYTFIPGEDDAHRVHNWWTLSLCGSNGVVFGGSVVGPIIAASHVDVFLASFKLKSVEKMRRRAAEALATASAATAEDSSLKETDAETVCDKYPMVDGKQSRDSPTSGVSPATGIASESVTLQTTGQVSNSVTPITADKTSESLTPKTADKTSESLTPKTTDKTSESFTPKAADKTSESFTLKTADKTSESIPSTMGVYTAGSSSVAYYPIRWNIDLEKLPDEEDTEESENESDRSPSFGLLTTDKPLLKESSETTDKPQKELSSETDDKPPESVTPAASDKPPENVAPAATTKSPENVAGSTSDTSIPVLECYFNQASDDIPVNLHL